MTPVPMRFSRLIAQNTGSLASYYQNLSTLIQYKSLERKEGEKVSFLLNEETSITSTWNKYMEQVHGILIVPHRPASPSPSTSTPSLRGFSAAGDSMASSSPPPSSVPVASSVQTSVPLTPLLFYALPSSL